MLETGKARVREEKNQGSGEKKKNFFFGIKIALSVEKKWKFHKSTHEKHQLYATSTDKYYKYFDVYSFSSYIFNI